MRRVYMDLGKLYSGFLMLSPFALAIIPGIDPTTALIFLVVLTALYFLYLKENGRYCDDLAILPALLPIFDGINIVLKEGNGLSTSSLVEFFCRFICGVWVFVLWYKLKATKKE
jgi:hypothetical protein